MSGPFDIFGLGADPDRPEESPARKAQIASARPLPKRFYDSVDIEENAGFSLKLDGRPVRTPARQIISLPDRGMAEKLAEEWRAQETFIDPKTMPITRLVNSALDGVSTQSAAVATEILNFAGSDLLCYRAEDPERLVEQQNKHWDPVLSWFEEEHGARFNLAAGVLYIEQPEESLKVIETMISRYEDPLRLAALHSMTSLLGSCLLALATGAGSLTVGRAWDAAHVDEDWNIEQWGADEEATQRRAYRFEDMKAAGVLLGVG